MNIMVLNAGRFDSLYGGTVRAKNLFVYPNKHHVVWVDPIIRGEKYEDETMPDRVPENVTLIPGIKGSKNPAVQWAQREQQNLNAARAHEVDVAVIYNAWGTYLARKYFRRKNIPIVFDYIDLMHAFRPNIFERKIARLATIQAFRNASAVVTTAHALFEDAHKYSPDVFFIPNGVDWSAYQKVKAKKLRKPAVGFVGGLGSWMDFALFDFSIDANFYFIGDGPSMSQLKKVAEGHTNVRILGLKPSVEARQFTASFDVCTIPFHKDVLTDAVCPIKLFEYWASHKPVLSSPLEEVKILSKGGVMFGGDRREWRQGLQELLENKRLRKKLAAKGFRESKKFDWKKLAQKMDKVLENV